MKPFAVIPQHRRVAVYENLKVKPSGIETFTVDRCAVVYWEAPWAKKTAADLLASFVAVAWGSDQVVVVKKVSEWED